MSGQGGKGTRVDKKEQDNPSDYSWKDLGLDALGQIGRAGLGYLFKDSLDPSVEKAGFQGKVEPRTMYRERVRDLGGPRSKLAGAKARQYFTDTAFVKDPKAATNLVKTPEVLDTLFTEQYTPDVLGDFAAPQILGNVQFTADTEQRKADQEQVIASAETAEADKVEDKQYHERDGKFYEILKPDLYDGNNIYDADGYEMEVVRGTQDPTKQYTADGYEIIQQSQRDPDKQYTDDGFEILERGTQSALIGSYEGGINPNTGLPFIFDEAGSVLASPAEFYDVETAIGQKLADQVADREALTKSANYETRPYGGFQAFGGINPYTGIATAAQGGKVKKYNIGGGIKQLAGGRYLDGMTDGMADRVPASIEGTQPAALSDGEFVIPADVVSGLGNGSSNAGAKVLDDMMTKVRKERTGNPQQGKEINPQRVMAKSGIAQFANGGKIQKFQTGGEAENPVPAAKDSDPAAGTVMGMGKQTGTESALSNYIAPYVMDMLGKGMGVGDSQYEGYEGFGAQYDEDGNLIEAGDISAGASDLQMQAFASAMGMDTSGAGLGSFGNLTQDQLSGYMNPYLEGALAPQIRQAEEAARRQALENQSRMTQAGSFGGSRQAIQEMLGQQNLNQQLADIRATGYNEAFQQARDQFGKDRQFGLDALQRQAEFGQTARDIYQDAIDADREAFEEARDFDSNKIQFMQSLLQGLPLQAQDYSYAQASDFAKLTDAMGDVDKFLQSEAGKYLTDKGGDFVDYITDATSGVFGGGEEST